MFRSNKISSKSHICDEKGWISCKYGVTYYRLPGGSVLKVYISGVVKKKRAALDFVLQFMLEGYLCVSGTCTLQIFFGNISKIF